MSLAPYTSIKIKENNDPMVDLGSLGFILEPKYFLEGLSADHRMFLRKETTEKLLKAQSSLKNYKLKIWDAFRSREVQNHLYKKFWSEAQTAHPDWSEKELELEVGKFVSPAYEKNRIPPHACGGTVDLTLVQINGKELNMGTEFDFFGSEAGPFFYDSDTKHLQIANNRRMLREAMEAEGFTVDEDEWWHFDWGNQKWALKSGKPFAFYGEVPDDFLSTSLNSV